MISGLREVRICISLIEPGGQVSATAESPASKLLITPMMEFDYPKSHCVCPLRGTELRFGGANIRGSRRKLGGRF